MDDKTSIIIEIAGDNPGDAKKQRTIQNISETATDAELYNFCQGYMALTNEQASGFYKVTRREITEPKPDPQFFVIAGAYDEQTGDMKPTGEPTKALTVTDAQANETSTCYFNFIGNASLFDITVTPQASNVYFDVSTSFEQGTKAFMDMRFSQTAIFTPGTQTTFTAHLPATDNYASAEVTITIQNFDPSQIAGGK